MSDWPRRLRSIKVIDTQQSNTQWLIDRLEADGEIPHSVLMQIAADALRVVDELNPNSYCHVCLKDRPDHAKDCPRAALDTRIAELRGAEDE